MTKQEPAILPSDALLVLALRAALLAGEEIMKIYETDFEVDWKADASPLTEADKQAHEVIVKTLGPSDIPLLSEEGVVIPFAQRKSWKRLWIVDPLDGTKEFINRNGEFTVNIALVEERKPIIGVIYQPVTRTLYFASLGSGAYKLGPLTSVPGIMDLLLQLKTEAKKLPCVTGRENYTVIASRSHMNEETEAFLAGVKTIHKNMELLNAGSSLKFCRVAEGAADLYPRFGPTMEWDTAAGQIILEESGKELIDDGTGEAMCYNRENLRNNAFIVK